MFIALAKQLLSSVNTATTKPRSVSRRLTSRRLNLENLERREVFNADLISAFALVNTGAPTSTSPTWAGEVAVDIAGNRYVTGRFSATVDFEPFSARADGSDVRTAIGGDDGFVAKYAPDNTLMWIQQLGGPSGDNVTGVALDPGGNLLVSGYFSNTIQIGGTTLTSSGKIDGLLAKFNSTTGALQWAKKIGTSSYSEMVGEVVIDGSGNAFVASTTYDTSYFDVKGLAIHKFNTNGTQVLQTNLSLSWNSPISQSRINEIAVDAAGNFVITGSVLGIVDFDPSSKKTIVTSTATDTAFVARYDSGGRFKWVSPFYGLSTTSTPAKSQGHHLAIDSVGSIIVSGYFEGQVDFNPGTGTTWLTGGGGFTTKLIGSTGAFSWATGLAGTSIGGIALGLDGTLYVSGSFTNSVDFDSGSGEAVRTSVGGHDIFLLSLSSIGKFNWVTTTGGLNDDFGGSIVVSSSGTIDVLGSFIGSIDLDPSAGTSLLTSPNIYRNAFVARFQRR